MHLFLVWMQRIMAKSAPTVSTKPTIELFCIIVSAVCPRTQKPHRSHCNQAACTNNNSRHFPADIILLFNDKTIRISDQTNILLILHKEWGGQSYPKMVYFNV